MLVWQRLKMTQEFDLTPDPRVLQMLGEIDLDQWRCIAELVDNSLDGFLHAARAGSPIESPEISISLPMSDDEHARVIVRDNGPGMSFETLENAVKAGWSGNDNPLSNLGLFGMGFNISTARLGLVTEVWTSRVDEPEQVGVRIDLNSLRATKNFRVPRQVRAKSDHKAHGTEVVIARLKPDQREYLSRTHNQRTIRKHLARTYSALLDRSEVGRIRILIGGTRLTARRHCVWSEERVMSSPEGAVSRAVEHIDFKLAPRRYCVYCMRTLPADEENCSTGSPQCAIEESTRRIHGWIGLQRYQHETDFGIDFIRNGRKIEIANKDLFGWSRDGETVEVEYPTDDQRNRGRFVGEIHLDHCRVSYTKNRFERDDPAWAEMVRLVRGEGPLRPRLARQLSYTVNVSPLYRLYQAFRRSSPQGKYGLWSRVLVVRDNERAQDMAKAFHNGEAEFLSDELWWQLVQEQDRELLAEGGDEATPKPNLPGGFVGDAKSPPTQPASPAPEGPLPEPPPPRRPLRELTRKYVPPTFRVEYDVQAFAVESNDPDLPPRLPWLLKLEDVATRTYAFLVDTRHEMFRSTTMTPLDALLIELTHRTLEFLRGQSQEASVAGVLADFRARYCLESRLEPREIIARATSALAELALATPELIGAAAGAPFYGELTASERETIARRMANRGVPDARTAIADGRFWAYADGASLRGLFSRHPELFLDGAFWDDAYLRLDFGSPAVTDEARRAVWSRYDAYLDDTIWLSNQTPADIEVASRDAIVRAACSMRLLKPDFTG
jgi:hypothetical protein